VVGAVSAVVVYCCTTVVPYLVGFTQTLHCSNMCGAFKAGW
jgi:hypothetical protein